MNDWTKSIKISFDADSKSYNAIKDAVEKLGATNIKVDIDNLKTLQEFLDKDNTITIDFDSEADQAIEKLQRFVTTDAENVIQNTKKELQELYASINAGEQEITRDTVTRYNALLKQIEEAQKVIDKTAPKLEEAGEKESGEGIKDLVSFLQSGTLPMTGNPLADYFIGKVGDLLNDFEEEVKKIVKESWEDLGKILESSYLSTSSTRETMFTYGFNQAQAYGFNQALNLLGVSAEDMWFMTDEQWNKFYEKFDEYTERYDNLYDTGFFSDLQEFNWEMDEFKEDVKYTIMQFIVDNKDLIVTVLHAIMDFTSATTQALANIAKSLSTPRELTAEERAANISSIINQQKYSSSKNVTMNNTFNNVSNQSDLLNSLGVALEQVNRSIGG